MEDPVEVVRYPEGGTPGDLVLTSFTKEDLEAKFGGVGDVEIFSSSSSTTSTLRKVEMFSSTVERIETSSTVEEVETSSTVRDGDLSSLIGDIEVASTVGEVEVASTVGDVEVVSTVGEVETASTVGDVEVASTVGDVEVVSTVGEVEVASTVGDVEVASTVGDVEVVSTVGDVEVASTVGEVETASTVGDVEVASTVGDIEVASTVGEVEVASTVGEVEATSTVGDVEVVSTVGDVEAASTVGDLEAASTVGDLEAASTVGDAETSSSPVGAPETSSSPVRDLETSSPGGDPEVISITSAHPEEVVEEEVVEEKKDRNREYLESPFECYLNTLLADLQNTIKPRDAVGVSATPPQQNYYESGGSAPPASPRNYNNHYNGTAPQSPHSVNDQEQVYQQQEVVEVVRSSDQRGQAKLSSVNNNLSELDTLLQDLNNARYTNYSKGGGGSDGAGPTTNGVIRPRPTVDSLLDELNTVGTSEVVEKRTVTYEVHNTTHSLDGGTVVIGEEEGGGGEGEGGGGVVLEGHATPTASSATKELDDLMASLSDFKVKENLGPPAGDLDDAGGSQGVRYNGGATPPEQASPPQPQVAEVQVQVVPVAQQVTVGQPDGDAAEGGSENAPSITFTTTGFRENTTQVTTGHHHHLVAEELKDEVPPRPRSPAETRPPARPSVPNLSDGELSDCVYARPLSARTPIEGCSSSSLPSTPLPGPQIPAVPPRRPPEDPYIRPQSGGPVKRYDTAYRWVSDDKEPDMEFPCVSDRKQEKLRSPALVRKLINASNLQSQVQVNDSAYAKPHKPLKSTPPPQPQPPQPTQPLQPSQPSPLPAQTTPTPPPAKEPTPTPSPTPTPTPPVPKQANQLDSMLGSLATHMTEQGVTTTQKGCCCACDKPIVGQVITALGKTWHPEHFSCAHCNQELGTRNFFEREGRPYCEQDYHNLFSPRCAYCNGPILDKCVTALNTTWHPEHFFCAHCGSTFGEEGFHEKDGKPYCRDDYFNMFAPKCGGCNSPIMDNYISALNAQWHPECFVCRDCRQPFNGGSFFDHEGLPYCETHYHAKRGSLCAGCHKPITGRCITAMFRKFHPEHFVCSFCLKQLNKGTFKEQNDKPYCHVCFDKLFG
ncbi:paxillin isoform X4 [Oratosquilla oratoria]|uniref:paxillin isoform X4 n=1 Tax=Oratosquilla oratoria TaxID=337810 RepID=UPI003F76F145